MKNLIDIAGKVSSIKKILLIFLLVLSAKGTTLLADDLNLKDKNYLKNLQQERILKKFK